MFYVSRYFEFAFQVLKLMFLTQHHHNFECGRLSTYGAYCSAYLTPIFVTAETELQL